MVLENISLSIEAGEFCTLVGTSGCGKSTFLKMLLGEENPTRGLFLFEGKPFPREPSVDRGIVFQRYSLFSHLTVLENVLLGLELGRSKWLGRLFGQGKKEARDEAIAMLNAVGLGDVRQPLSKSTLRRNAATSFYRAIRW